MKKIILLINLLLVNYFIIAQNNNKIDSLKIVLSKTKVDTSRIKILNEICYYNFYENPKIGMEYSEIALNLSEKINWTKGLAVSNNHLGMSNWVTKNYEKSINNFKKALAYYKELKDQKNISDNYNRLGLLHGEVGKYNQALIFLNLAYQIDTKINDKYQTANDLSGTADIYFKMGNYPKALNYYTKANQQYSDVSDIFGVANTHFQMGNIYALQKKYTTALQLYNEALSRFTKSKSLYHIGNSHLQIGKINHILSIESKKDKKEHVNISIKNLKEAVHFFTEYKKFDKVNECYLELSKIYEENDQFMQALESYKNFVKIDKTYLNYDKQNELDRIKNYKEFELKNKKIEIQKLHIKSDSRKVLFLVIITIAIAILLSLFLLLYVSKRKANQMLLDKNAEISNINKQKDKFFSIIAHDLRGPFNGFLGLTELLAEDIDQMDKEEVQFVATNMNNSAKSLHILLENLLEWSRMEQGLIPFSPKEHNLHQITNECIALLQENAIKKDITIETDINQNLKIFADYHILESVIRNIVSNALKFTPRKGNVKIQALQNPENTTVSISDTGIGMNAKIIENLFKIDVKINRPGTEDEPSTGLGLILCKEFVEKHNGKIWVESQESIGTSIHISFPRPNHKKVNPVLA